MEKTRRFQFRQSATPPLPQTKELLTKMKPKQKHREECGPRPKEQWPHARATRVPFFVYASEEGKRLLEVNRTASPLEVLLHISECWTNLDEASREFYEREAAKPDPVVKAEILNAPAPLPEDEGEEEVEVKEEVEVEEEVRKPERRFRRKLKWLFCCGCPKPKPVRPKMKP